MEIKEGYISFKEYKTYYRIANPSGTKTPLLILHGGPGSTHNSFELLDDFAFDDNRPIISYDQLGCGNSSIPDDKKEIYTKETWVEELINLRNYLHLDNIHLLGHSWGGMLAIIYLCDYDPKGIESVILSSTLSSVTLWKKETHRIIEERMGKEILNKVLYYEKNNDFDNEEFKDIFKKYWKLTINDIDVNNPNTPECLRRIKKGGSVCYKEAWGDSEYTPNGNLKNYEYTSLLNKIKIPALVLSGSKDESTYLINKTILDNLGSNKKEWHILDARHMTYYEQNIKYVELLKNFIYIQSIKC